jgi:hypothetical protein
MLDINDKYKIQRNEDIKEFRNKYKNYKNYRNMLDILGEYKHNKYSFKMKWNSFNKQSAKALLNIQRRNTIFPNFIGGMSNPSDREFKNNIQIKQLNQLLSQYKKANLQIDELESTDSLLRLLFYTIDNKNICLMLLIDYEDKIATISDLKKHESCLLETKPSQVIEILIDISKEIAKQLGMIQMELSDSSYFTCNIKDKTKYKSCNKIEVTFPLSYANTLTNGIPYYYEYKFKYSDDNEHNKVKYNKHKLKELMTKDLNYGTYYSVSSGHTIIAAEGTLLNKINKNLLFRKCNLEEINKSLNKMSEIYDRNINKNIKEFLYELKYADCVLFAMIFEDIWDILELKKYIRSSYKMKLEL